MDPFSGGIRLMSQGTDPLDDVCVCVTVAVDIGGELMFYVIFKFDFSLVSSDRSICNQVYAHRCWLTYQTNYLVTCHI